MVKTLYVYIYLSFRIGYQKVDNPKKFFNKGRVFLAVLPQPAGPSTKDKRYLTRGPYGQEIFTKVERFVVIRNRPTHCLCLPIHTYGGRAAQKYSSKPNDQYSVFAAGTGWDEERLLRKELPVVVEDEQIDIKYPEARIDCSKVYTIEHYVIVRKIGRIDKKGLQLLENCFRLALDVPLDKAELEVCYRLASCTLCASSPLMLAKDSAHLVDCSQTGFTNR